MSWTTLAYFPLSSPEVKDLGDDDECRVAQLPKGNIMEGNMTLLLLDASLGLTALCLRECIVPQKKKKKSQFSLDQSGTDK